MKINSTTVLVILAIIMILLGTLVFKVFSFALILIIRYFPIILSGGVIYYFLKGRNVEFKNDTKEKQKTYQDNPFFEQKDTQKKTKSSNIIDLESYTIEKEE